MPLIQSFPITVPIETPISSDSGDLQMKGSKWSDVNIISIEGLLGGVTAPDHQFICEKW